VRRALFVLILLLALPTHALAQKGNPSAKATHSTSKAETEIRQAIRDYDGALRRADVTAVQKFWAEEYTFINTRGERLTRADRLANLRTGQTAFDSLAHAPQEEKITVYGDVAVYTTLLTIRGLYGGQEQEGSARGLVVWVRRKGQWQQVASQLTAVQPR
jgi:ketosteroid isomerase-like protein